MSGDLDDGLRVRFDVHTDDVATAMQIAEQLSRQAVGYAAEGMVTSIIVVPSMVEVEVETEIGWHEE